VSLAIPPEGAYGLVERDLIDNEPPGLFPASQDSYWGQVRKTFADGVQAIVDILTQFYYDLDPRTASEDALERWEQQYGLPVAPTNVSVQQRRANVMARVVKGPFTRTRRRLIVESFIIATFGPAIQFTPEGVPFVAAGTQFFSGEFDLTGLYAIVEDVPNFFYTVRIKNTVTEDTAGLTRELARITAAGIDFTIVHVATP
jgi:hypothetical protein